MDTCNGADLRNVGTEAGMSAIREERLVTLLLVSYERKEYPARSEYGI